MLRLIAEKRKGRRIFEYRFTNAHFASGGYYSLVPDWYIVPDGPMSQYHVHGVSYSEYQNRPLSKDEYYIRVAENTSHVL